MLPARLSKLVLSSVIDVHSPRNVSAYLKVLNRIGRVKGFSPATYEEPGKQDSFCLSGNSNGIGFLLYDWEATLAKRLKHSNLPMKEKLSMLQNASGILRAEIRFSDMKSIRRNVSDHVLRRKMLSLLTLIPEKKSLYLAQKAMNCRNIDKVMEMFAKINVSPVTISKRHGIQYLRCFYEYLLPENN